MEKNYQLLNEFLGMKCSVGVRSLTNSNLFASFIYQSFTYYIEDGFIYLEDETNDREASSQFELSEIKKIENLCDNLYRDVVSFWMDGFIIEVCTLEEPFIFPKCHKCGKDILIPEAVNWHVAGHSCYENPYDNDMDIIDNLNFCSDCMVGFIGSIEDYNCVGEYSFS
ncbi:MAG: hypothetical protein PHW90_04910 [Bacilli bacterium]|nr:hypothetical protein [Bacilli bacterium]